MIHELLLAIIVGVVMYHALISMWRPRNFPPGPLGLPFVGSFHYVLSDLPKHLTRLSKKYGNIFSVKLKGKNIVCISGYKLIRKVMLDHPKPFSNRAGLFSQQLVRGPNLEGVAAAQYGPKWAAHRKLFYTVVRNMGLSSFDQIIREELPYFIDEMQSHQQSCQTTDPSKVFDYAVLNILAYYMFGSRYSYGDAKFKRLLNLNNKFFELAVKATSLSFLLVSFVPYLHNVWLPKSTRQAVACSREIEDFIATEIKYHKSTLDHKQPRDIIDYYLVEMINQSGELYSETGLLMTLMDFFQAGTETTSTTLKWAVLYMVNNPEIQGKVQREIDEILGPNQLPKYEDRLKMPYTEATVLEVQRKANITPGGLMHATTENVKLEGYDLPKGTCILASYTSLHFSPEHWKNPEKFDPENFLDPDGKVGARPAFMPYGGGLRICLGMNIAKQELFLFFVAMMQHFNFFPPPGISKLDEDYVIGGTLQPKQFRVVMEKRQHCQ